jgi:outer membrane protein assembly factor BamD (BamD/ComL family)
MSLSGISGSNWASYENQSVQNNIQQFQQDFEQLGEDLQSGNLSAAQTDFTTLQSLSPQSSSSSSATSSSSSSTSSNPIAQEFQELSQALQSGNLTQAQTDYSQLQQDFQSQSSSGEHHHHHHESGSSSSSGSSEISQLFSQLGQDLTSGSLTSAQQVYNTLEQTFQGLMSGGSSTLSSLTGTGAVSTTA